MKFLDKIYVNIYWVVNKRLNPKATTIWVLDYLLLPVISGLVTFIVSVFGRLLIGPLNVGWVILCSLILAFFASEKFVDNYFTNKKQDEVIKSNPKPGVIRYIIFVIIIFGSLFLMLLFFLLAGVFLN